MGRKETLRSHRCSFVPKQLIFAFSLLQDVNTEGKRQPACTRPNGERKRREGQTKHQERRRLAPHNFANQDRCVCRGGGGLHRLDLLLDPLNVGILQHLRVQHESVYCDLFAIRRQRGKHIKNTRRGGDWPPPVTQTSGADGGARSGRARFGAGGGGYFVCFYLCALGRLLAR